MKAMCIRCGHVAKLAKDRRMLNGKWLYKKHCVTCEEEDKDALVQPKGMSWAARKKVAKVVEVRNNAFV